MTRVPRFPRVRATLCLWLAAHSASIAAPPPESFSQVISTANASVTVDFVLRPIRSANFGVIVQQADGNYVNHVADGSRTYLGTVRERPGAIAAGLLRANGTLWAQISFETGSTWTSKGGLATARATGGAQPLWTDQVIGAGGAGTNVYVVEVGIDATHSHFVAGGSTPEGVLETAEFSLMAANLPYLRDAGIENRLGKLVVRAHQAHDPYQPDGSDKSKLLQRVRTLWNQGNPMGRTHHLAAVIHSGLNGGLAHGGSVGVVGTSSGYSVCDSDFGEFWKVFRHESGHNWGCGHTEGGGRTEGDTIMSGDNALDRFTGADLVKISAYRNSLGLQNLGNYPLPLPPRANLDTASFLRNTPVTMDVLANDSDMNGESLALVDVEAITTNRGGSVTLLQGAGPGGRDLLQYTPPPTLGSGIDWFRYRIEDSSGMQGLGFAVVRPRSAGLTLADHWELDDDEIGSTAVNRIRATHNGTRQNEVLPGEPGATPVTRTAMYFNGVDERISIPAPGYNKNTLTMTAWIRRVGNQNAWAPFVLSRAVTTAGGIGFGTNNELRYHWNNMGHTWQPSPALVPPDNEWCLVALSVGPTGADLFLRSSAGLQSARNAVPHQSWAGNAVMYLGHDSGGSGRWFKGWMDDVRVYTSTLTEADVESLYQQAVNPPLLALTEPEEGAPVSGLNLPVAAAVGSSAELVDRVDFVGDGVVLATDSSAPYESVVPLWEPGWRVLLARAAFGDWGYEVESAPLSLTVLPPDPPVVSVTASSPASKLGAKPGVFTFTRDHGYGEITVSFTLSGDAVAGTDYEAIPVSITFAEGELTKTIVVTPIAAAPDGVHEELTLSLEPGSGYGIGTSSAATLTIGDHATYVWTNAGGGNWNVAGNWDSSPDAPVWGADVALDFSTLNITANPTTLSLGSAGKIAGKMIFGDTSGSQQWKINSGNGPLTLATTVGGKPVIETTTRTNVSIAFAGTRGFEKTGSGILMMDNSGNSITGEIHVSEGSLFINNGGVNTPNIFQTASMDQRSLRISGSGLVDLWRIDANNNLNLIWPLPAVTLENGGTLRVRNNNAKTYNHTVNAAVHAGPGGGEFTSTGGTGEQNTILSGALTGSGPLHFRAADGGSATRGLFVTSGNNSYGGDWTVSRSSGSGVALLRADAANALGTGRVIVGKSGRLLNNHATGLDSLAGVTLDGVGATLALAQPWHNPAAELIMAGGAPLAELADAASVIGNLSGIPAAILRGTGENSSLTVHQTMDQQFAGEIGPDLQLTKSGPARLELSGGLDANVRLTAAQGELALAGDAAEIVTLEQTGGDVSVKLLDETTAPLTVSGDYVHSGGVLRVAFPDSGIEVGASYPIVVYGGSLTGQPPVEFTGAAPAVVDYGSGSDSAITVTFLAEVSLIVDASPEEGGSVSGGGIYQNGDTAEIEAVPASGWRFAGWAGEGVEDAESPTTTVLMDESKTVTAHFVHDSDPYQAWAESHGLAGEEALRSADPDGDGLDNELECLLGLDPTDPNSTLRLSILPGPEDNFTLVINRVIPEGAFTIESAASPAGPWAEALIVPLAEPGWNHEVTVPDTGERRFFRLRVSFPDTAQEQN